MSGGDYSSPQTVDKAALGFASQSHFSFFNQIAHKIENLSGPPSFRSSTQSSFYIFEQSLRPILPIPFP